MSFRALTSSHVKITCYFTHAHENNMLFSEVKRMISQLLWLHNSLKSTLMCSCVVETSSDLPRKSSAPSEFLEMFENDCLAFGQFLDNLGKSSESVWKSSENRQRSRHCYVISHS